MMFPGAVGREYSVGVRGATSHNTSNAHSHLFLEMVGLKTYSLKSLGFTGCFGAVSRVGEGARVDTWLFDWCRDWYWTGAWGCYRAGLFRG